MNVRIQTNLNFVAGVYYDGELLMNNYQVRISMITVSDSPDEQNIALERARYFVYSQLSNSIFINQNNTGQCELLTRAGVKISTLPEEPVDQIVGIMLFCKLNSIMEDMLLVSEIGISSTLGDNIVYLHGDQESLGPFVDAGWWNSAGTEQNDFKPFDSDHVVALNCEKTWRDLGLAWSSDPVDIVVADNDNKLVFADFQRDESK